MLSRELMGYVALWILWGNTLLVALAAAKRAIHLLARASWLGEVKPEDGEVGVLRGTVTSETLAELSVEQNGRHAAGGAPTIVWHDRGARSQVAGGEVELADGTKVEVVACERGAEVWLPVEAVQRAAACPDDASFDAAYAAARRVKGFARSVVVPVARGARVQLAGKLSRRPDGGLQVGPAHGRLLVATIDPARWARERAFAVLCGFIPAILAGAAACTALALREPVFESLASKAGGLLGFVFFLLVLPAGTAVRDFMREPHQRFVRGKWTGSRAESAAAAPAA